MKKSPTSKPSGTSKNKYFRFFFGTKKRIIFMSILLALVIFRLFLPLIVKRYVNRVLSDIPGYHGWVDDIDIALYRGAYVINGLHLYKNGNKQPMLDFPKTDISIEWKSLFKGRIVSEIEMYSPKYNYLINGNKAPASNTNKKAAPKGRADRDDWTEALHKLVPIRINRLKIMNGKFLYSDIIESPDINLAIDNINAVATNLGNVVDKKAILPSDLKLTGVSFGKGALTVTAKMNVVRKIPNLDVNVSLKNSDVTALNTVTMAAAGFDFEKGQFELYSEFAINNGYLKGYFKPMFHNIRIPDTYNKPSTNVVKRVWEGIITFFGFILKNKPKDSFATVIPIEGDINNPDIKVWRLIVNIFRNAFIRPFQSQVDNTVNFSDADPKALTDKEKRKLERKKEKEAGEEEGKGKEEK